MLNVCCVVWGADGTESVAITVKLVPAATVGTPEISPARVMLSPDGKDEPDASTQVTGGVPPELSSVTPYAEPTKPRGTEVVETVSGGFTATCTDADFVLSATAVAVTVTVRLAVTDSGVL